MKLLSMGKLKPEKGIDYSRPHLYRLIAAGKFPKPIHTYEKRIAFVESEIDAWIRSRIAARDAVAA